MILVDTNVLVAMAIENGNLHHPALDLMEGLPAGQGVLPTVLAEACYLIDRFGGARAEAAFLRSFEDGALRLVGLLTEDLERMTELVERCATLRLGATDASVVAVAERLDIDTVATFDRRHFTVVRPRHVEAFTLLQDL